MDAIHCEGLSRSYGEVQALKDLDLSVPHGAIFGFLGRNGAGKTTTIRLLTGLAQPTRGKAWVDGVETTNGEERGRRRFGYLPEEPAFYGWLTPFEFLDYIGQIYELETKERLERVDELLELVDLTEARKRRIQGFSRGMRQRLGLAQALIHKPPVLFLDEPTSALDPAGRRDVLDLIDRLRGQTTVFLSSHILADVERVCDTVGVIHEGKLLLVAARDELLSRYASNALLLSVDRQSLPVSSEFIDRLRQQSWVEQIESRADQIRVNVRDLEQAKAALLPLVVEQGVVLSGYEWVRPTLEDVFLRLSTVEDGTT